MPERTVVICASLSQRAQITAIAERERAAGHLVHAPDPDDMSRTPAEWDRLWLDELIPAADEVIVIPKPDGTLGEAVEKERRRALELRKPVRMAGPYWIDGVIRVCESCSLAVSKLAAERDTWEDRAHRAAGQVIDRSREVDRLTAERDQARRFRDALLEPRADVDRVLEASGVYPEAEGAGNEGGQAGVVAFIVAQRDEARKQVRRVLALADRISGKHDGDFLLGASEQELVEALGLMPEEIRSAVAGDTPGQSGPGDVTSERIESAAITLQQHGYPDVAALLDSWPGGLTAAATAPSAAELVTAISTWLDNSYQGIDREAHLVRRCVKAGSEFGEMLDALYGWLGENPRKGVTHTRDDLRRELLDVALAALGAVEHVDGNAGTAIGRLDAHIRSVADRAVAFGLHMPASTVDGEPAPPSCGLTADDPHNTEIQHPCTAPAVVEVFTTSGEWVPACERHSEPHRTGQIVAGYEPARPWWRPLKPAPAEGVGSDG